MVRSTRGVGVHPLTQESQVLHCGGAKDTSLVPKSFKLQPWLQHVYNADVSDGSACKIFSWSFKLEY